MGIVVVLIFYAVAITIAASIGSALFGGLAYILTKRSGPRRKFAVIRCALFPFVCALFVGAWFVVYATVNYAVFDRDPGLGDGWQTPLPNGYVLSMIDTTDQGTVYNPKTQSGDGSISSRADAVFGVRQLQVAGAHIFGANDTGYFGRIGQESKFVDSYFELDTSQNKVTDFKSLDDLRKQAFSEGVTLNLRAFESVFGDYRTTWFDYLAGIVLIAVPLVSFALLSRWVWRIRLEGTQTALTQNPSIP
jgi:hypothetical protein